ncbi:uncharacterized protein LOC132859401 [Tachysurus vachellii]|uniref:uncharacterized protein LOC132859401 n=1 Tax=Tachysurus vachellii TaxID=175792 RepID=UPI00296AE577|nr:uncharacterized protein LOC132859401 [Tachysurus vachellii]
MAGEIRTNLRFLLITYPEDVKDKHEYKHEQLRKHPETLRADISRKDNVTNLLFYTQDTEAWYKALCSHYTNHTTRNINDGRQIKIEGNDTDSSPLTVNIYRSGTVMFQGSEARLSSVQDDFEILKALSRIQRHGHQDHNPGHQDQDRGDQDQDQGHQDHNPGNQDYNPGNQDQGHQDQDQGHQDQDPGHRDHNPGHQDYNPGHRDHDPGHRDHDPQLEPASRQ